MEKKSCGKNWWKLDIVKNYEEGLMSKHYLGHEYMLESWQQNWLWYVSEDASQVISCS